MTIRCAEKSSDGPMQFAGESSETVKISRFYVGQQHDCIDVRLSHQIGVPVLVFESRPSDRVLVRVYERVSNPGTNIWS